MEEGSRYISSDLVEGLGLGDELPRVKSHLN